MQNLIKKKDLYGLMPGFYHLEEYFGIDTDLHSHTDMLVELDDWYTFWYRRDNLCCFKDARKAAHRLLPEEEYGRTWALVYLGNTLTEL